MYIFWTQLGLGLFLLVCLAITVGLLLWCRARIKRLQSSNQEETRQDQQDEQDQNQPPEGDSSHRQPTPTDLETRGPLLDDLNSAWNNDDSSLYDNPTNDENPFVRTAWNSCSSFKPICPAPALPESVPMVQKPLPRTDRSTMTYFSPQTQEALNTLERNAMLSKQVRARWTESAEHLNRLHERLLCATQSHLEQAGYYIGPYRQLPPLAPVRTSSLRQTNSRRNRKARQDQRNVHRSADPIEQTEQTAV